MNEDHGERLRDMHKAKHETYKEELESDISQSGSDDDEDDYTK